jgi:hypothetical protein
MDQTSTVIIVIIVIVVIGFFIIFGNKSSQKGSVKLQADIDWLMTNGNKVIAQVTKVEPRTENGQQYYYIIARRPGTNRTDIFEDKHYKYDLRRYIGESYVHVAVVPTNSKRYFIYGVEGNNLRYPTLPPLIIGSIQRNQVEGVKNIQEIEALYKHGGGETVKAGVVQIKSENNGTSHYVIAEYTKPHVYESHFFRSGNFRNNRARYAKGSLINVRYNPNNAKQYYIDLYSSLP